MDITHTNCPHGRIEEDIRTVIGAGGTVARNRLGEIVAIRLPAGLALGPTPNDPMSGIEIPFQLIDRITVEGVECEPAAAAVIAEAIRRTA